MKPNIYMTSCMYLDLNGLQELIIAAVPEVTAVLKFDMMIHVQSSVELSDEQKALVDSTKMAFADTDPEDKVAKICDIAKSEAVTKHFHNVDYIKEVTTSLIPKRTVSKGEVTKVDWFKSLDVDGTPIDKILTVDIVYNRDASGFALSRTTTRTWINRDETENEEKKITSKLYFVNPSDMIIEGLKRRKLLVNSIQIPTMTFMGEVLASSGLSQAVIVLKGRAFMDDYDQEFNKFVENSSTITDPADAEYGRKTIIVKLENETNAEYLEWLNKAPNSLGGAITIKQYLINEFDI